MSITHLPNDTTTLLFLPGDVPYIVPAGANLLLVVLSITSIDAPINDIVVTVTYNVGINNYNLTKLVETTLPFINYTSTFYLTNPITNIVGSNITFNYNSSAVTIGSTIIQSYANVDTDIPFQMNPLAGIQFLNSDTTDNIVRIPQPNPIVSSINKIVVDTITINPFTTITPDPSATSINSIFLQSTPVFSGVITELFFRDINNPNRTYLYQANTESFSTAAYNSFVINGVQQPPICVAGNTKVLMANGTEKEIWDIERGDLVFTNEKNGEISQVAQITKVYVGPHFKLEMVRIQKGALGKNMPNKDMLITGSHPIVWNGERKRARYFKNLSGVTYYKSIKAKDILPIDENGHYALYDLIFEDNLYYMANGVQIQAHSPECIFGLLPKEAYFNKNKIGHVKDYVHPMVNTLVKKIN